LETGVDEVAPSSPIVELSGLGARNPRSIRQLRLAGELRIDRPAVYLPSPILSELILSVPIFPEPIVSEPILSELILSEPILSVDIFSDAIFPLAAGSEELQPAIPSPTPATRAVNNKPNEKRRMIFYLS